MLNNEHISLICLYNYYKNIIIGYQLYDIMLRFLIHHHQLLDLYCSPYLTIF
jgi:hypothetical protein